ncbi:doublecortin domain-containing protein 2C [Microcaecilia unicolor]|uniref:Doublecortin domain-containing protein 2C n=1 Tax=Microcaecilia unicolor TaxID=1415580 RepID=A0A6P7XVQ7_9AMPH|nr:doublecortin domain-containing protein 2C [Microcaecilia unicolor]
MAMASQDDTYYERHPTQLIPARSVVFYRNGDPFFVGRKLVINGKHVPTFDALLSELTRHVPVPQGSVLRIFTPGEGHRVTTLDDILPGHTYVVANKDSFHQLDYVNITVKKPEQKSNKVIKPVVHSKIRVPSRWGNFLKPAFFINVLRNGDLPQSPLRIVLPKNTLNDWNRIRSFITEKVQLVSGPVQRLYTLNGKLVLGPSQLEHNQYYVAVGMEKFMALPYYICVYKNNAHGNIFYFSSQADPIPPIQKKKQKNIQSTKASNKSSGGGNPGNDQKRDQKRGTRYALLITGRKPSVYYAKSSPPGRVVHPVSIQHILLNGPGVFRASKVRDEFHGAKEVEESRTMKRKRVPKRRNPRKRYVPFPAGLHYSPCYVALSIWLAYKELHH